MRSERESKLVRTSAEGEAPFKIRPEDIEGLDNSSRGMIFASYLMAKDPNLSSQAAVKLAIELLISTDPDLKRIHEDATRRYRAMIGGFSFSAACLIAILISVYVGLPAAVSIALIGVMMLSIGMTFIIVASKVTQKGFSGMVDSVKSRNKSIHQATEAEFEEE